MILTITLNPSVDRTVVLDGLDIHDTNRIVRTEIDAGGKGINLSRIAVRLGTRTVAAGFLGGDEGSYIRSRLDREGVSYRFVEIAGNTRVNINIEDGSELPPTTLNERGPTISPGEWHMLEDLVSLLAPKAQWVCVGGSIPPGLDSSVYSAIVDMAKGAGAKVCVDADGDSMKLALDRKPNLVKPNRDEAERLLGRPIQSLDEALWAAGQLVSMGIEYAMVSLGSDGAVLAFDSEVYSATPPDVEAVSTIGSGDSLIGGFLSGLTSGATVEDALKLGVAAGTATALSDGAEIGKAEDVYRLLPNVRCERVR